MQKVQKAPKEQEAPKELTLTLTPRLTCHVSHQDLCGLCLASPGLTAHQN